MADADLCVQKEVIQQLSESDSNHSSEEVRYIETFITSIVKDTIDLKDLKDLENDTLSEADVEPVGEILDEFLDGAPTYISLLRTAASTGSAEKSLTQNLKVAGQSHGSSSTEPTDSNSTNALNELDCAFAQLGASVPRTKLRDIIATNKARMLAGNPDQFTHVWGHRMNVWAKCQGGGMESCPCCYLCKLPLIPTRLGGQPEMEHVVPCPVAYKSFPNMDTLRHYYPFILLPTSSNDEYMASTKRRVYDTDGFGGEPRQSLRATMDEREDARSMRDYWDDFTSINLVLLKKLYNAINCETEDDTTLLEIVKGGFKTFLINEITNTVGATAAATQGGAFDRIFEYCFSVISIWLYELAYAHRWCNQTKWDVSLHDTESITALLDGKKDPRTGKASKINTSWTGGKNAADPIIFEFNASVQTITGKRNQPTVIKQSPMGLAFIKRLTTPKGGTDLSITQNRVMKVWDNYDKAVVAFPKVSVCTFTNMEEIKQVMWLMNLSRILRFTEIGYLAGLKYDDTATTIFRDIPGATSTTGNKEEPSFKRGKCEPRKKINPKTFEEVVSIIKKKDETLEQKIENIRKITIEISSQPVRPDRSGIRLKRLQSDRETFKREVDALRVAIAKLYTIKDSLDESKEMNSPARPRKKSTGAESLGSGVIFHPEKGAYYPVPPNMGVGSALNAIRGKGKGKGKNHEGGTRRKRLPNKSNRTRKGRRARKSKRKPKRTRRARKSSKSTRKKKTRRRVKK
jgi:hypothetical protein